MENNEPVIDPLKKVSLTYTAGRKPASCDLISEPRSLDFIFGIGTEGLTGLECALAGKSSGEKGTIEVPPAEFEEIFGRLVSQNEMFPINPGPFFLHYTITGISDASPGEVVKSMATAVGSGCGGGCGCGCGSH